MTGKPTYEQLEKRVRELEQAELERMQTEEELAELFSMSLDLICIADINTATLIKVNPAFTAVLGFSKETLLERSFLDFVHPDDIDPTRAVIEEQLKAGAKVINFENRYRCKDGSYRWLNWTSHPNPEQGVTYAVARDITDKKRSEKELEENQALLEATSRMSRVGGWELDLEEQRVVWTRMTARIHELPDEWFPSLEDAINYYHPDDREMVAEYVNRAVEEGIPYEFEARLITAKGRKRWVRAIGEPTMEEGRCIRLSGTFQDVTERKAVEQALRESERRLEVSTKSGEIGLWELDLSDGMVWRSLRHDQIFGYETLLPEWTYEKFLSHVIKEDRHLVEKVFKNALKNMDGWEFECRIQRKDGALRWIWAKGAPESDGNDQPARMAGVIQDITDRKEEQREAIMLKTAIDQAPVGIALADKDINLYYCNPEGLGMRGGDIKELLEIPKDAFENWRVYRLDGEPYEIDELPLVRAIVNAESIREEFIVKHQDGKEHLCDALACPVFENRKIIGGIVMFLDITDRRAAEEERERLNTRLQQITRIESIGSLAGGVAHDFNNMLSVILGYGEEVFDGLRPSDPLRDSVREILDAGRRSAELTKQLLAFSRRQTLQPKVLDLNQVVTDLENMLGRLIGEDIELISRLDDGIGLVEVDPLQIELVIVNMATNARDAMPYGGKLTIETSCAELDEEYAASHPGVIPGEYVMLSLSDNGCGMNKETLNRVFEPFFTTKEIGRGTGLGLATVYGIVKQSGGNISVYSEPDQGTTFKVYLPKSGAAPGASVASRDYESIGGKGETILVVEDESSLRRLCERMLTPLNYNVIVAANGGEALLLIEEKKVRPDLLMTDVVMPGMSGKVLVDRLQESLPEVKVLYMSGYTDHAVVDHGVLDPGVPFIHKPFTREEVGRAVRSVLDTS